MQTTVNEIDIERRKNSSLLSFRYAFGVLLLSLLAALVLKLFVLDAIYIPSQSMEKTLLDGDYVLVNKLVYGARLPGTIPFLKTDLSKFHLPAIREIADEDNVVFDLHTLSGPENTTVRFVKRCLARSGDEIEARDGDLFVNGTMVSDKRILNGKEFFGSDFVPVIIPHAGDVVDLTNSSRWLWEDIIRKDGHEISIDVSSTIRIDGTPATRYKAEKNYLIVVGDNVEHSYDSRDWGFLPQENVIGEAMMIYWSVSPSSVRLGRVGMFPK